MPAKHPRKKKKAPYKFKILAFPSTRKKIEVNIASTKPFTVKDRDMFDAIAISLAHNGSRNKPR